MGRREVVVNDLLERLEAAIAGTERIALSASTAPWRDEIGDVREALTGNWVANAGVADRRHIIHNDPSRTLRGMARDRRLLARHAPVETSDGTCCQDCSWLSLDVYEVWPCPDVRDLAEEYDIEVGDRG